MTQVPLRMAQPGLVPPHQQRPPMMVSMTQPPPVSMQGLVSMSPMMGPGGGMAVMTQAMSHPDSGHDHHHTINTPYHPHHHHHQHPPRPHAPPQGHHSGPPHHPSGPHHPNGPQQAPHSAPTPSQYHPGGPMHGGAHHSHGSHSSHHSGPHSHSGPHNNTGGATHGNHSHPQAHLTSGPPHMPQSSRSVTHPTSHQLTGMKGSNINVNQTHHQQSQQQSSHHQQMPNNIQQSQQQPQQHSMHQHSQHNPPNHQPPMSSHAIEKSSSAGVIILNSNNPVSNINVENSAISSANGNLGNNLMNTLPPSSAATSINNSDSSDPQLSTREKTPMCLINELARYNKIQHQYCLTDEKGPAHKKTFTVTLRLGENEEEYSASGPSIKKAQHSAAALALDKTKYKHPPLKTQRQNKQTKLTPTVELNALAMKRGEAAVYTFMETPRSSNPYAFNLPHNMRAIYNQKYYGRTPMYPMFFVSLRVGTREFVGDGTTAQQAKHNAASKALKVIKSLPMPDTASATTATSTNNQGDLSELDPNADLKSPISLVHEIALKRNLTVTFEVVRESGPPHMRTFVTTCIVGDIRTEGEGTGKKVSKKKSAELMLEELRKLPALPSASVARMKRKPTTKKKSRNLIKVGQEEQKAAPEYGQGINPISRLIQIQQAKKEKEPVYTLLAERGVPRRREFVMQVTVGLQSAQGSGPNKKLAKRAAAESMLQLLGYSRPQPQPGKPALKMDGSHSDSDKTRKSVTFLEESMDSSCIGHNDTNQNSIASQSAITTSSSGRQLIPGLIIMPDGSALHGYQQMQQNGMNVANMNQMANTVAIAKELLESGSSPTAKALSKKQSNTQQQTPSTPHHMGVAQSMVPQQNAPPMSQNSPQVNSQPMQQRQNILSSHRPMENATQQQPTPTPSPQPQILQSPPPQTQTQPPQQQMSPLQLQTNSTNNATSTVNNNMNRNGLIGHTSGQAVRPKDQLMYLANILNLQVQFTDFPKGNKSEYLSLVSLSTMPPHVSHGAGPTIDASHDQACLTALRTLAEMGLDTVTSCNTNNSNN